VRTKDALLRGADAALHAAKRDGGNRICVYQQQGHMYTPVSGSNGMETELRPARAHSDERANPRVAERVAAAPAVAPTPSVPARFTGSGDRIPPRRKPE